MDSSFEHPPILCAHLIRRVDEILVELLGSLGPAEWDLPTVAGTWQVRDVAAHLLDTALRKLSLARDGWFVEQVEIRSSQDLAALVNRMNREGVAVYRRLSPSVLVSLMQVACTASADYHESLDPFAPAAFAVSWAGQDRSPNWFDTARELTERWHHQQQIRLATGRPGLMTRELYYPVLDCFLRALPFAYRDVVRESGTRVRVDVSGDCGGAWEIERQEEDWRPAEPSDAPHARVAIPQQIAWRIFTRGIGLDEAAASVSVSGDRELAFPALRLTAIVA